MKKARFDSERNCSHCLYYRSVEKALDDSIISGTCIAPEGKRNITKYHGVTCPDFVIDPTNPLPRYKRTDEEKEAIRFLNKGKRSPRSLSVKREKVYPTLNIKTPLVKSKKKQALQQEISSDNEEVKSLLDRLFKLPKRSCAEGRKIRKQLRKLGYFLSKKGE